MAHLAVCMNFGVLCAGVLMRISTVVFGVYIRATDFWKLPFVGLGLAR